MSETKPPMTIDRALEIVRDELFSLGARSHYLMTRIDAYRVIFDSVKKSTEARSLHILEQADADRQDGEDDAV